MRYSNRRHVSLRCLGAAAVLSGALLMIQPAVAHADDALVSGDSLVPDGQTRTILAPENHSVVEEEGRSPVQTAAETTKNFADAISHFEAVEGVGVSIENIAAEQERQKIKEIELARVEAGVKAAEEERARIAEEERLAAEAAQVRQAFVDAALDQVGTPYVSGGAAPGGFDCSGLVKYCVAQVYGYEMPRTAAAQSGEGESVSFGDLQTGDLLFWGSGSGVYHVAIYVGNSQYVHAPRPGQSVKVQTLESYTPTFAKRLNL